MPYIPKNAGLLDYATLPLKVLGSPWGALQTGIAGGDWQQALADPDTSIRGRQFLEKMGWADPNSGAWADAAGMGLDIADPLSMLAFGGIALGLDRLVMLLCDARTIDEVRAFCPPVGALAAGRDCS